MPRWNRVAHYDAAGNVHWSYKRQAVSRIPDDLLDFCVYLYPTEAAAQSGSIAGGSGILLGTHSTNAAGMSHTYVVTNAHVIANLATPVLRINRTDGSRSEPYPTDAKDWLPGQPDDLSALPMGLLPTSSSLDFDEWGATPEELAEHNFGAGDDVFMVGRLTVQRGRESERNRPVVRFGNLALMPGEPVRDGRNVPVEAFLVDMRSRSGFSGSPVFGEIPPGSLRFKDGLASSEAATFTATYWLLGIDTGHIEHRPFVCEPSSMSADGWEPVQPARTVKVSSGIAIVAPAWRVRELLDRQELRKLREDEERGIEARRVEDDVEVGAVSDIATDAEERIAIPLPPEVALRAFLNTPKGDDRGSL